MLDHGLLSAFSLVLQVVLVRAWSPQEYGLFGFWLGAADAAFPFAYALFLTPLIVHLPRATSEARRAALQVAILGLFVPFLALAAAAGLGLGLVLPQPEAGGLPGILAGTAMIVAFLGRSYASTLFFALQRPARSLAIDALHVGVALLALAAAWLAAGIPGIVCVLAMLALSQGMATGLGVRLAAGRPRLVGSRRWWRRYRPIWRLARWSLVGALATTLQNRCQVLIVGILAGPAAYGAVLAGGLLAAPPRLVTHSWTMVARPRLSAAVAEGDMATVRRLVLWPTALVLALFGAYAALLAAGWPLLRAVLFRNYGAEMATLVVGWMLTTLALCLGECVSAALQGLHEFRRLAWATVLGSIVGVAGALGAVLALGYPWVMLGPFLGALVALAWMVAALRRSLAERAAAGPSSGAPR